MTHRPVMVREVLKMLSADRGGTYVDATFGAGGHSRAILQASAGNRVVAFDRDPQAVAAAPERLGELAARAEVRHSDYRSLPGWLAHRGLRPDGIVADLGYSSLQMDDPARGFSFRQDGPLDMRFDPAGPGPTAADLVNSLERRELQKMLRDLGEEPNAQGIARAIVRRRSERPFQRTVDLAAVVEDAVPVRGPRRIHPATRTFQALRIAVNGELDGLDRFVQDSAEALCEGGRMVVISFHSLEDRIVKLAFRRLAKRCICPPDLPVCGCNLVDFVRILTQRPLRPEADEVADNPRSRSARLRAAERLAA